MAFDFPNSPSVGQQFPAAPNPGDPIYAWDGEKWASAAIGQAPGTVRYDTAQSLTSAQQTQARQNIFAAPFDALAYSGIQINGAMDVTQERARTVAAPNGGFLCDGWIFNYGNAPMVVQGLTANAAVFPGIPNFVQLTVPTAQPSLAATDVAFMYQSIEGYRMARLGWGVASFAQPITIAFWSCHNRVGIYTVSVRNGAADRTYCATYTQNVAGAAEYKTVTIPGDTTGTWMADNTRGIYLSFVMAAGSGNIASAANAWLSGGAVAAPGQVNGVATTADFFRISGVVVLPGSEAPTAVRSPFIMRPFDQELLVCERYYQKYVSTIISTYGGPGAPWYTDFFLPIPMRAVPTMTFPNLGYANAGALGATYSLPNHLSFALSVGSTAGFGYSTFDLTLDARL